MAQFVRNAHWTETSPSFAHRLGRRAHPSPIYYKKREPGVRSRQRTAAQEVSSGRFAGWKAKESGNERPAATRFIAFASTFLSFTVHGNKSSAIQLVFIAIPNT